MLLEGTELDGAAAPILIQRWQLTNDGGQFIYLRWRTIVTSGENGFLFSMFQILAMFGDMF